MDDMEVTRKCAEAMGYAQVGVAHGKMEVVSAGERFKPREDLMLERPFIYDPLHNDAQCFALVEKFGIDIIHSDDPSKETEWGAYFSNDISAETVASANSDGLHRAICECIATLPAAPEKSA